MLQADGTDTTNQLLALSVSTQLRTAGTIISDTLNQTLSTLADAVCTSFSPSTATRWINILFFLSLVFSLAAALFSILAKQWIREYIKWNSPLALPRENVFVRQIRIEAWEDWQVSMVLSSIPILLEVGMILFLASIIILLWTLDDIVAITITIFISLFLGAFAAFTVMPILSRRCPYRSPTAWAFCVALRFVDSSVRYIIRVLEAYGQSLKPVWQMYWEYPFPRRLRMTMSSTPFWRPSVKRSDRLQTWRDCDLESRNITKVRTGRWWLKTTDLYRTAGVELARESIDIGEDGALLEVPEPVGPYTAHALLVNIAEVFYLVRALAWVRQSSQSTQVVAYVDQCMDQLHRDTTDLPDWTDGVRMVTTWCVMLSLVKGRAQNPHLTLLTGSDDYQGDITQLRRASSGRALFPRAGPPILDHLFPILMRLLAQSAIQRAADPSLDSPQLLRRRRELLGVLRYTASRNHMNSVDLTWYIDALNTIRLVHGSHDLTIRLMTFEQLLKYGKVTIGPDQTLCEAYTTLYLLLECSLII